MNLKLPKLLWCVPFLLATHGYAQQRAFSLEKNEKVKSFTLDPNSQLPKIIQFNNNVSEDEAIALLGNVLDQKIHNVILNIENTVYNHNGIQTVKLHQYINGVKIEHAVYSLVIKNGSAISLSGASYVLPDGFSTQTALSPYAALEKAKSYIGANEYVWEYLQTKKQQAISIEAQQAFQEAVDAYTPTGELVIVDDFFKDGIQLSTAYKFNIYAAKPLTRNYVYVDANTGKILLDDPIIKHVNPEAVFEIDDAFDPNNELGSGDTRYAGNRSFYASQNTSGDYELLGLTSNGIENETRSLEGLGGLPLNVPAIYNLSVAITDNDNNWTSAEHKPDDFSLLIYPLNNEKNNDDIALDAHWGAEVVLEYWFNEHSRSSYDGLGTKVFNFVHYGEAYDNAFWNGEAMTYGDGSSQQGTNLQTLVLNGFLPLTSMDVCSHEIGHGVCEFTSNLVYQKESGAMNEGFSDIWAACVENYVLNDIDATLPYDPWGIGEQIDDSDGGAGPDDANVAALRWMDDPKAEGDPDSYGGANWQEPECEPTLANDYCGVHGNSGVLNKWFYLLVAGSGQALTPGASKVAMEDQISDAGHVYDFDGIGFEKAEQIAFLAETMLSPTATFADMRDASIIAAQTLYGFTEEETVTKAWYAVDIGEDFDPGDPNRIFFNSTNTFVTSEAVGDIDCGASKVITVGLTGVAVDVATTITLDVTGTTAVEGKDYMLSASTVDFPAGNSGQAVTLTIFHDYVVDGNHTIQLSFSYNGEDQVYNLEITDDDIVPSIGTSEITILPTETFDTTDLPLGWTVEEFIMGAPSVWQFNGTGNAAGTAYIAVSGTETAGYDLTGSTNSVLKTPMISAIGAKNVTVSFDWQAGGEVDLTDGTVFDYGEFMYSLDGTNYVSMQQFTGTVGGNVVDSGTFTSTISALDNTTFYLAWRWFNDDLVGSSFSFTVDNVMVNAMPTNVETVAATTVEGTHYQGDEVYYVSTANKDIIAKIENASTDMGCLTLTVEQDSATATVEIPAAGYTRTSKYISLTSSNPAAETATYDITLYYTDSELTGFSDVNTITILKSDDVLIDNASATTNNFSVDGGLFSEDAANTYKTFKGTFTGTGAFALATSSTLVTDVFDANAMAIFPSVLKTGEHITIHSGGVNINMVEIFDLRGARLNSIEFSATQNTITVPTQGLASGMYILAVDAQTPKSFKFIVK